MTVRISSTFFTFTSSCESKSDPTPAAGLDGGDPRDRPPSPDRFSWSPRREIHPSQGAPVESAIALGAWGRDSEFHWNGPPP
jgi:hypothetical protein